MADKLSDAPENAWIEWKGGVCPLPGETGIMYRLRNGWESDGPTQAGLQRWDHGRRPEAVTDDLARRSDIIAYRVVQP